MSKKDGARFEHDCASCIFLGHCEARPDRIERGRDVYWHVPINAMGMTYIVGRYGSDSQDFTPKHLPDTLLRPEHYLLNQDRWYLWALLTATRRGLWTPLRTTDAPSP